MSKEQAMWKNHIPPGVFSYSQKNRKGVLSPDGLSIPSSLALRSSRLAKAKEIRQTENKNYRELQKRRLDQRIANRKVESHSKIEPQMENQIRSVFNDPWVFSYFDFGNLSVMVFFPAEENERNRDSGLAEERIDIKRDLCTRVLHKELSLEDVEHSLRIPKLHVWPYLITLAVGDSPDSMRLSVPDLFLGLLASQFQSDWILWNEHHKGSNPNPVPAERDYYSILYDDVGTLIYIRHIPSEDPQSPHPPFVSSAKWGHWKNRKVNTLSNVRKNPDFWLTDL